MEIECLILDGFHISMMFQCPSKPSQRKLLMPPHPRGNPPSPDTYPKTRVKIRHQRKVISTKVKYGEHLYFFCWTLSSRGLQWLSKALPGCVFNKGLQIEAPSSDWSNCHYHSRRPVGEQWNSAEQKTIEAIFIITDWHFISSGSRQRIGPCLLLLHILCFCF